MSIFNKKDRLNSRLGSRVFYGYALVDVKKLLDDGADPNATYKYDYTRRSVLLWAAGRDKTDVVELLLARGANPDPEIDTAAHETALTKAIEHRNLTAVKLLLAAHANIEVKSYYGDTPILQAAKLGEATIVQALVEAGANINAQSSDGSTALHYAAAQGHANLARFLVEHKADIKLGNANLNTAADVADREYPRIAAMIRGEKEDTTPATPTPAEEGWRLTAAHEVARILDRQTIGYRLTEIFNFEARLYTQLARNLETGAESQTVKGFAELDDGRAITAAQEALVKLGGKPVDTALDKKKLQAPGQGA